MSRDSSAINLFKQILHSDVQTANVSITEKPFRQDPSPAALEKYC